MKNFIYAKDCDMSIVNALNAVYRKRKYKEEMDEVEEEKKEDEEENDCRVVIDLNKLNYDTIINWTFKQDVNPTILYFIISLGLKSHSIGEIIDLRRIVVEYLDIKFVDQSCMYTSDIAWNAFKKEFQEIIEDLTHCPMKISIEAYHQLLFAAEQMLITRFRLAGVVANHAKRVTIMPEDLKISSILFTNSSN